MWWFKTSRHIKLFSSPWSASLKSLIMSAHIRYLKQIVKKISFSAFKNTMKEQGLGWIPCVTCHLALPHPTMLLHVIRQLEQKMSRRNQTRVSWETETDPPADDVEISLAATAHYKRDKSSIKVINCRFLKQTNAMQSQKINKKFRKSVKREEERGAPDQWLSFKFIKEWKRGDVILGMIYYW